MADEIIFKVGVDTGNSVNDLSKIDSELQDISKTGKTIGTDVASRFEELNKRVASGTMTMRESAKAVKEYQTIALQAGRESPIGKQAIAEAGQLTDELGDLKKEIVNAGADGANMKATLELGSGLTAGYGAVQGAMALVGGESESLQKTMVKMQAVQSVLAGIEQVRALLEKESLLTQKAKVIGTKILTAGEIIYATAVGGTTGAMKALRISMLALPIVAIIAAIAALVAGIAWLVSEEETAEKANEALTKSYERQQEVFERSMAVRKRETQNAIDLAKLRGASDAEIFEMEKNQIKENESLRRKSLSSEKNMIEDRRVQYRKALQEGNEELATKIKEEISQHKTKFNDLKVLDGQYKVDIEKKSIEFTNAEKEKDDKANEEASARAKVAEEKRRKAQEDEEKLRLELQRTLQDLTALNIADQDKRELAQLGIKHERERAALVAKYGENTELLKQLDAKTSSELIAMQEAQAQAKIAKDKELEDKQLAMDKELEDKQLAMDKATQDKLNINNKSALEAKLIALQDDFDLEQELKAELALLDREQALMNKDLTEGEKLKIDAEYEEKLKALKEESKENDKRLREEEINNAIEWTTKGLTAIQDLSDVYFSSKMAKVEKGSKEEENLAKKQFKFNKALQLGGAIIDAGKAITASLASAPIAIGAIPNPAGIASLAFAGASSASSIAKILSTKFDGGSGGSTSVAPPSIGGGGGIPEVQAPQLNTSTLTSGLNDNNATKVYVLDSDITAKQNTTKQVETLSTYG